MKGKLVYPYSDALLNYEFRKEHPLTPNRLKLTRLLSEQLGLLNNAQIIEPTVADRTDLEMFHAAEFIDAVVECGDSDCINARYGLGIADNPTFPGIYDAAARYVGATLDGMKEILKGASNAFCISGGLHHAHRSEASGFCIFNDVVTAVMYLQKKKPSKVLYLDIFDAHHGDGVQNAFYRSKDVLTISAHQTGKTLFPGTGFVYETGSEEGIGYSVNVPVLPGAGTLELIRIVEEVVVPLFESFQPNLLVTQLGVDGHFLDPLAQLAYTSSGYETCLKRIKKLSEDICDVGWLAVGGGGYHPVNVARLWTLFLAIMLDEDVPRYLPDEFKQECTLMGYNEFPETMRDEQQVVQQYVPQEQVTLDLDRVTRRIAELVFPYHGI